VLSNLIERLFNYYPGESKLFESKREATFQLSITIVFSQKKAINIPALPSAMCSGFFETFKLNSLNFFIATPISFFFVSSL